MPQTEMRTRPEAIDFLSAQGFHAFERDWVMGQTIGVAAESFEHNGITMWRRMIYIAPTDTGWKLEFLSTRRQFEAATETETLLQACELAANALRDPSW